MVFYGLSCSRLNNKTRLNVVKARLKVHLSAAPAKPQRHIPNMPDMKNAPNIMLDSKARTLPIRHVWNG